MSDENNNWGERIAKIEAQLEPATAAAEPDIKSLYAELRELRAELRAVSTAPAAPAAPAALAESTASQLRQLASPPPNNAPGYRCPGAPSGDPDTSIGSDPGQWDADTVARKVEQGVFREEMERHNRKQYGLGFNPFHHFRRKIPS